MGLTLAVVSLVLSVISIALLAYDAGEKRGFRYGYEIGKAEGPEAGLSAKEHEKGA